MEHIAVHLPLCCSAIGAKWCNAQWAVIASYQHARQHVLADNLANGAFYNQSALVIRVGCVTLLIGAGKGPRHNGS